MNSIIDNQRSILLSVEGTNIWSGQQPQQYNSQAIAWGGLRCLFFLTSPSKFVYEPSLQPSTVCRWKTIPICRLGVFDWVHGASTILDHVQIMAKTQNRLLVHPCHLVRRTHIPFITILIHLYIYV